MKQLDPAEASAAADVEEQRRTDAWLELNDQELLAARSKAAVPSGSIWPRTLAATLADYPSASILAAWVLVEKALRRAMDLTRMGFPDPQSVSVTWIADSLVRNEVITAADYKTITKLRRLRNEVAHGGVEPSPSAAIEYAEMVDRIVSKLSVSAQLQLIPDEGEGTAPSA